MDNSPAMALRRRILSDEYVDRAVAGASPSDLDFQEFVTSFAWGVWARGGPLSLRDRSLLVLAMTAAMGRMEEFALHAGSAHRAGVTDEEVDELILQVAAYCGAPAGVSARRVVRGVRAVRDQAPQADPEADPEQRPDQSPEQARGQGRQHG